MPSGFYTKAFLLSCSSTNVSFSMTFTLLLCNFVSYKTKVALSSPLVVTEKMQEVINAAIFVGLLCMYTLYVCLFIFLDSDWWKISCFSNGLPPE